MYREDGWVKGHYIDNLVKYKCRDCEREFIVGEKLLEDAPLGYTVCPYCGQSNVERISWTEDDQLADIGSEMGCLAICIDEEN